MTAEKVTSPGGGAVLRLFRATPAPGLAADLVQEFTSTSAPLVEDQPGCLGYLIGTPLAPSGDHLFATLWRDLGRLEAFAGPRVDEAVLPDGYRQLLTDWDIHNYNITTGKELPGFWDRWPAAR